MKNYTDNKGKATPAPKKPKEGGLSFEEVEPWPVAIDPAALLSEIAATIERFIVCSRETVHAATLWIAMTWFIEVIDVAPLAIITAPEKRCGKSQLLSLMGKLSARSLATSSISPAALFRTIEEWRPTLFIDETDACLKDNEELRGLLNSGHTRDTAYVIRTVGEKHTPTRFCTWGAKALAGIGHLPDTLMDRAVILELRRKLPQETAERLRHAEPTLFIELKRKLARFAEDYSEQVKSARPPLPAALNDRAQDNWEPLLAIALVAGEDWLNMASKVAKKLSGVETAAPSIGAELLADISNVFAEKATDRISTVDLIKALCADDEAPWATYNRGAALSPRQLAAKLRGYSIHSKTIRLGYGQATLKGYEVEQFSEAFERYIPADPPESVTTSQSNNDAGSGVTDSTSCAVTNNQSVTPETLPAHDCDVVTHKTHRAVEAIPTFTESDFRQVGLI